MSDNIAYQGKDAAQDRETRDRFEKKQEERQREQASGGLLAWLFGIVEDDEGG
jgi:hypothetical protein